ncbi:BrnT family toxin [Thermodesulfobacteriota bacterium]
MSREVRVVVQDWLFTWNSQKADANLEKHEVSFEEALEVFFFPYYDMEDASVPDEQRWSVIGYSMRDRLLYVVAVERGEEAWRIISARPATRTERARYEEKDDSY